MTVFNDQFNENYKYASTNLIENLYFNLFFLCVLFPSLMLVHSSSATPFCQLKYGWRRIRMMTSIRTLISCIKAFVNRIIGWNSQSPVTHWLTLQNSTERVYFIFNSCWTFFFVRSADCLCAETPSAVCTRAAQREQCCQLHERRLDNLSK